jgi:hypothetical protein
VPIMSIDSAPTSHHNSPDLCEDHFPNTGLF